MSMKKTRFLVLVLVVSIMLVGAGYAYWTETLTINNTVSTGKLDVKFAGDPDVTLKDDAWFLTDQIFGIDFTAKVRDNTNGNIMDIIITNFYPGAIANVSFTVQNDGTVPVMIDKVNGIIPDGTKNFIENALWFGVNEYDAYNDIHTFIGNLPNNWNNIVIYPGRSQTYTFTIRMPETITGDSFENSSGSFSLQLDYIQVN